MDTQAHDVTMKTLSLPAILLCVLRNIINTMSE
jgi:hypothetical protein